MKSKMKMMVRAYDKELKIFTDLKNNKRTRRQLARVMAIEWVDDIRETAWLGDEIVG